MNFHSCTFIHETSPGQGAKLIRCGKVLHRVKIGQMWGHSNAFDSSIFTNTDAQDEDLHLIAEIYTSEACWIPSPPRRLG